MMRPLNATIAVVLSLVVIGSCQTGENGTGVDFSISPNTAELGPGETVQLTAIGAPRGVVWSSSNSGVATVVAETGFVTAVARGAATISAVAGSSVATAQVSVVAPAQIQVSPEVVFDILENEPSPAPQTVTVQNGGDRPFQGLAVSSPQYTQGQPQGWLTATLSGTTVTLTAAKGTLAVGEYTATVRVTATNAINSPQSILVRFRVQRPPSIAVSRDLVPMTTVPGGTSTETVQVTNGGGRTLGGLSARIDYGGGARDWLTATLSATQAPATLTLRAASGQLPLGNYAANVVLESTQQGILPVIVRVALTVTPFPAIQLSNTNVAFTATFQGTPPLAQTVNITNGGGGTLSGLAVGTITYGAGATNWLTASISPTTAPATLTLNVNQGTLAQGTYTATVPVTSSVAANSPVNVQVSMTVGPPPMIVANPGNLSFGAFRGGNLPGQQNVAITNANAGAITGLSFTVSYTGSQGWLTVSWAGGTTTPATLIVRPNDTGLGRGTYNANIRVTSNMPGVAPRDIPVTYTISTFDVDVYPLFIAANPGGFPRLPCTQCHGNFSNATNAYSYLTANSGVLICKITGGAACPSEMRMPSGSVGVVQNWLNAGAPRGN